MHQSLLFYVLFSHIVIKVPGNSTWSFPTILPSILLKAPLFDFANSLASSFVTFPTMTAGAVNPILAINWPFPTFSPPQTTTHCMVPCIIIFRGKKIIFLTSRKKWLACLKRRKAQQLLKESVDYGIVKLIKEPI